ncbi:hypothetical protein A3F34_01815 [Candidatus Roizmanbacteria bacterium RIFCSPHIGHO2_12_FULL_44_10]|uniref:General secretion pathway GspH domain-containing protein n=1 Tax=Candidatus Roizmanbacteria bacterium RIFCSPHIGHO2_12_FULL_44_10 TaxID=1802054 RepID=A0A1F7I7I2_9BACT|nr:MAG: hypothetical protein A3F34_01815 [Candidatus Roizmanbacteria bacterium RIFCSPHIGHO2_12_FULL_44_10]
MKSQSGVTFIELFIVISILSLLATLAVSSYRDFDEQKKLDAEALRFSEVFEQAKKRTISGDKPCDTFAGTYTVGWTTSSYTLTPDGCSAVFTNTVMTGLTILNSGSATFQPFGRGATSSSVIVKHSKRNRCRNVVLTGAATITNDPITCP